MSNWESASERRIRTEEAIDRSIIAGRYAPLVIFANQVLLHHDLAISFEWLGDMTVHRRVRDSDIPRDVHRANLNSIQTVHVARSLEPVGKPIFRYPIAKRRRQ